MKEVEILVEVFNNKETVLNKLKKFESKGTILVKDIYFYHPNKENMQVVNGKYPKTWLRLRNMNNTQYLAYKIDRFEGDTWIYSDEYETEISNVDSMIKILDNLGFKTLLRLTINKENFITDSYEIDLEDVEDLGLFLEVERLNVADSEDVNQIKKEIQKFIDSLGIKTSSELNLGKPELMLKRITKPSQ